MEISLDKYFLNITSFFKKRMGVLSGFIFVFIFMCFSSPHFLSLSNILNILRQSSIIGIVAAGMTIVILTGGIDFSVGSILAFSSCVGAEMIIYFNYNIMFAMIVCLLTGAILGFINGFFITKFHLRSFIVTLATMGIIRGFTYILIEGDSLYSFPERFKMLGNGVIGFIPIPVIMMFFIYLLLYVFLNKTNIGRLIYAIGDNEKAALFSGIPIKRYKLIAYIITGILAALAGIILTARLDIATAVAGEGFELDVIAAVVIGGTSLSGGKGNIFGSLIGALMMGAVRNGLNLLLVSSHWQRVILGLIIIIAVSVDVLSNQEKISSLF